MNIKSIIARLLQLAFVCSLFTCIIYFSVTRPRILVVQSYDLDYSWTVDVEKAVRRVLAAHNDVLVHYTYMNTKKSSAPDQMRKAGTAVDRLVEQVHPDVLILVDDNAQKYVGERYRNHKNISVVFAGVNADPSRYGYDQKGANVTGILERIPLEQTKHVLQFFTKSNRPLKIFVLGDRSNTVVHDSDIAAKFDWGPHQVVEVRMCRTFGEWQDAVREWGQHEDAVILVTNYQQLVNDPSQDRQFQSPGEIMAWTSLNSKIPTIGNNGFVVKDGGGFAVATSPYEQGEVAAQKAVQIVKHGKAAKTIAIDTTKLFMIYMNGAVLEHHNIQMPHVYKAFANVTNSFYNRMPVLPPVKTPVKKK